MKTEVGAGTEAEEASDRINQVPGFLGTDQWTQAKITGIDMTGIINPWEIIAQRDFDKRKALIIFEADIERWLIGVHQIEF